MSRLRNLDSKVTFFAFADIITAVSGVLIFVALLLATDLGKPVNDSGSSRNLAAEQQLQETLEQQASVDARNQRLETLLTAADSAPDKAKLQADIDRLRAELAAEQKKDSGLDVQLMASQAAIAARDQALGLTDLNAEVQRLNSEADAISAQESLAHDQMDALQRRVEHVEAELLKLREREGQVWLIPEKSATTKEPIIATVSGSVVTVEPLNHPDGRREIPKENARTDFDNYLHGANPKSQYVLFLVRPSGIDLFKDLLNTARNRGFEVGFDALEENRVVHFSIPPAYEETEPSVPVVNRPGDRVGHPFGGGGGWANAGGGGQPGGQNGGGGYPGGYGSPGGQANGQPNGSANGGPNGLAGGSANGTATGAENGQPNGRAGGQANGSTKGSAGGSTNGPAGGSTNGSVTGSTNGSGKASVTQACQTNRPASSTSSNGLPPPKHKSWWQRLLEWLGFKTA